MTQFLDLVAEENLFRLRASVDTLEDQEYVDILRRLREAGAYIESPKEREWLATAARRWSSLLYDRTGAFHNSNLVPFKEVKPLESIDPGLFVGRETELQELIDWSLAEFVSRRLMTIVAPPGYGKSWLLSHLEHRLADQHGRDLFLIHVPTLKLRSTQDIVDWLSSVVAEAKNFRPDMQVPYPTNSPDTIIAHLLDELSPLRPLLLVDAFDELFHNERRELEKNLLQPFWSNSNVRIIMAFRNEFTFISPYLRRGEERFSLEIFTLDAGQKQLQILAAANSIINLEALISLIPPYRWTHPQINASLYNIIEQRFLNKESPLLTADDLRNCWVSLIEGILIQNTGALSQIENDLKAIVAVEDTWTLETFSIVCQYDIREAFNHIDQLFAIGFIAPEAQSQRYQVVDGIREIIRAELRLREAGGVVDSLSLTRMDSGIGQLLQRRSPFDKFQAEAELDFLFGEIGGFWSGHKQYAEIFNSSGPQLILGERGSGKTSFAQALVQLGSPEGIMPEHILPFYTAEASIDKIKNQINRELKLQKAPWKDEDHWLAKIKTRLSELNLEKILVAVDLHQASRSDARNIISILNSWEGVAIKLFLNSTILEPLIEAFPDEVPKISLTWTEDELKQMAEWRFERLVTQIRVYSNLEMLFDEDVYAQFIQHAQRNPRRLVQLWQYMFEDYRHRNSDRFSFSGENLDWAVRQLA